MKDTLQLKGTTTKWAITYRNLGGKIEIGIVKHDQWRLAAHLKGDSLSVGSTCFRLDQLSHTCRASECDLVYFHVRCNCSTRIGAITGHNIEYASGETCFLTQSGQIKCGEWSLVNDNCK